MTKDLIVENTRALHKLVREKMEAGKPCGADWIALQLEKILDMGVPPSQPEGKRKKRKVA